MGRTLVLRQVREVLALESLMVGVVIQQQVLERRPLRHHLHCRQRVVVRQLDAVLDVGVIQERLAAAARAVRQPDGVGPVLPEGQVLLVDRVDLVPAVRVDRPCRSRTGT
jgi:hypothetical protein